MKSTRGRNERDSYRGPIRWLVATVVLAIVMVVVAATLLRTPVATDPFDASASAVDPAAGDK